MSQYLPLYYPRLGTTAHKSYFSVIVIPLCNSHLHDLMSSYSFNSFKTYLFFVHLQAFILLFWNYLLTITISYCKISCLVWDCPLLLGYGWLVFPLMHNVSLDKEKKNTKYCKFQA